MNPIVETLDEIVGGITARLTGSLSAQHKALTAEKKKLVAQRDQITAAMEPPSKKLAAEVEACTEEAKSLANPDRPLPALLAPLMRVDSFPPKKLSPEYRDAAIMWLLAVHGGEIWKKNLSRQLNELQKQKDVLDLRLGEIDKELAVVKGKLLNG